jgi:hypothetical protein
MSAYERLTTSGVNLASRFTQEHVIYGGIGDIATRVTSMQAANSWLSRLRSRHDSSGCGPRTAWNE